jgi:hypothetical protein
MTRPGHDFASAVSRETVADTSAILNGILHDACRRHNDECQPDDASARPVTSLTQARRCEERPVQGTRHTS